MKSGWKIENIGNICTVIAGQSPPGQFYNNEGNGLPFYQGKKQFTERFIGNPVKWTSKVTKEANKDDILMSVRAPVGPVNFSTQTICIGRGLAAIRAGSRIDKDYLFNFLIKHESEITGNTGAVFNSINKSQIESIQVPLPPLPEQKRLVSILDKAFAALDKAIANTHKNLQNARELFDSYLNEIFSNPGEDWENKRIEQVCSKLFAGGDVPKQNLSKIKTDRYNIPIYSNGIKNKGLYGFTNIKKVTDNSVTVSARGTIGHAEIRKEIFFPIVRLIVLVPNNDIINLEFLKYILDSIDFSNRGVAIPQLTVPMIRKYKILFPTSIDHQTKIVDKLDSLSSETKRLESIYQQKLDNLKELKQSILQKAFEGEL
jgi:type I restriction enzyme S subunit